MTQGHKFVPPAPDDRCDYVPGPDEDRCRLPLSHPTHFPHLPPAILHAVRVEASNLQQLNDLQREKSDALSVMLEGLGGERHNLRDGRLGNITRYYVQRSRSYGQMARDLSQARADRDDAIAQRDVLKAELNEANDYIADHVSSLETKAAEMLAETDEDAPEYSEVPPTFLKLANAALDAFAEGYAEYGPGAADALGLAGQWGDLHRKVMKLKRSLWNGRGDTLTRETETEVLQDIIGHCLLALDMIARDMDGGRD